MRKILGWALSSLLLMTTVACTRVATPLAQDELVVAVRDTPSFIDGEEAGFEYDLLEQFAAERQLKLRLIRVQDHSALLRLIKEGKAHLAASAAIFGHTDSIRYTQPLREIEQVLVQANDDLPLTQPKELSGKQVEVLEASPQAGLLQAWNARFALTQTSSTTAQKPLPAHAPILLAERRGRNDIDLLERVSAHKSRLVATDRLHFDIASSFYPNLRIAQSLDTPLRLAWAFPAQGEETLFTAAQEFIARNRDDGTLARLNDRYFGHLHRLDQFSVSSFLGRISTTLPRLRHEFVKAQEATGLDWRLLASLAYQESLWNPLATSPTNVRGIMMLTEETADRLRVTNRLDARQSIQAGARYLNEIIANLPADIPQPDRTWMGIAAYNLGQGHMNGALQIAKTMKRDNTSWYEMKQVLPLMAKPEYYRRLKSGRARGGEAVIMVENIRKFYDILSRFEPSTPILETRDHMASLGNFERLPAANPVTANNANTEQRPPRSATAPEATHTTLEAGSEPLLPTQSNHVAPPATQPSALPQEAAKHQDEHLS